MEEDTYTMAIAMVIYDLNWLHRPNFRVVYPVGLHRLNYTAVDVVKRDLSPSSLLLRKHTTGRQQLTPPCTPTYSISFHLKL